MTKPDKQHGGARKGAGRKPAQSDLKPVSMRLPQEDRDRLDKLVELTGKKKVEVVRAALEEYEKLLAKSGA